MLCDPDGAGCAGYGVREISRRGVGHRGAYVRKAQTVPTRHAAGLASPPRLLARAARYGTHRFVEKSLDLEVMLHAIRDMIGEA